MTINPLKLLIIEKGIKITFLADKYNINYRSLMRILNDEAPKTNANKIIYMYDELLKE